MIAPELRRSRAEALLTNGERLAAVRRAALLDSPVEEAFDSLSRLAGTLIGTPVTFLSVVDAERDFYKSQCGMPEPLSTTRQLSGQTFCQLAIAGAGPLAIPDTHAHEVWRAIPSVDTLGVRAYLGVPLMVDGQPVGSFCCVDMRPREWTAVEIETLVQLGRSAEREIELRRSLTSAVKDSSRAHALARENEELVAVIAHDLRSPLQVIGFTAALLSRLGDDTIQPHVKRLDTAVVAMKQLVDGLLVQHATAQRETRRTTVSTAMLLTDAVETMRLVSDNAGLRVAARDDAAASVLVDYAQLLRVFCNLIGNCVKYCPAGTSVLLSSSSTSDGIVLTVSDDGPGMPDDDQARAFERGWQGGSPELQRDGAGLGLAIVRDLVGQNNGTVSLTSEPGRGTSVQIVLRASDAVDN